jgi:arylsulfatase A-like enzyme
VWQLFGVPRKTRALSTAIACVAVAITCPRCASWSAGGASQEPQKAEHPVILISIDGLRPEFYQPGSGWNAPVLQALAARGATAEAAEPIYPTVTYSNHTTLVTGVHSAQHGILSNTVFTTEGGSTPLWYWDASHVKAPTIWARAQAAGLSTAILTWPATVGAKTRWVLPEIFASPPVTTGSTWALMRERMDPELERELTGVNQDEPPEGFEPRDRWVAGAASHLLKNKKPDFTLIHIIGVDKAEHDFGRDAPETKSALRDADVQLGRILSATDPARATILLTGDHGFYDYDKLLRPATLWASQPWASRIVLHPAGGSAAVYVRGSVPLASKDQAKLMSILRHGQGAKTYRVLGREELDRLQAFPGALCALDPVTATAGNRPGYSIVAQTKGPLVEKLPRTRGNHGPVASDPHLMTGLIAVGPGIKAGTRLGRVRLLDIAPTVASLLGVPFPEAQGRPIDLSMPRE